MLSTAAKPPHRIRRSRGGIELPRVDGRTLSSRRFRQLAEAIEAELGGSPNVIEQGLIKQAVFLQLRIEALYVAGHDVSSDEIIRLSSESRRVMAGLSRRAANKPAPEDALQRYLAEHYGQADEPETSTETTEPMAGTDPEAALTP